MGARETLGGEVDAWRPKLCDVFGRGGISDRQCRSRSGNVDVQGKIRNGGLDQRRGGIRSACRRATVKARHVQSNPHPRRTRRRKRGSRRTTETDHDSTPPTPPSPKPPSAAYKV